MLTIGLFFNGLTVVIGLLAVLANFTALQRFWMLRNGMRE